MDPLTAFVVSVLGAVAVQALRGRHQIEDFYPKSAKGELEHYLGWMPMRGRGVSWWVEEGRAVWISARYVRPMSGNIFYEDKLGAVARAVRSRTTADPIEFYASYGQISVIGPETVAESISYRDDTPGDPYTTGDRDLDAWLCRKYEKESSLEEDEEMEPRLAEAVARGDGDLGKWAATTRDGNHRTFGAILGGEDRVAVRLYDNDEQDMREAVKRARAGRPPEWHDAQMLDLLRKCVADTGRLPDWLDLAGAVRVGAVHPDVGRIVEVQVHGNDPALLDVRVEWADSAADTLFLADRRMWAGRDPGRGSLVLSGGDHVVPVSEKLLPQLPRWKPSLEEARGKTYVVVEGLGRVLEVMDGGRGPLRPIKKGLDTDLFPDDGGEGFRSLHRRALERAGQ